MTGQPRNARGLWFAVGRLAPGVPVTQARSELEAIGQRLASAYPATNSGARPVVQTFRELFIGPDALAIYGALWAAVGVLLLIACANLANLLLARSLGRTREVGVRLALGASQLRVIRQQLLETSMLALAAAALGLVLSRLLLRAYEAFAVPPTQPWASQLMDYSLDTSLLVYLVAVFLVTAIVTGLLPALRLSRLDVAPALRDGGRGTVGRRGRRRTTGAMVIAQVALTVVLLAAAGVLARSFLAVQGRALGFDPGRVLITLTMLPAARYPTPESQFGFYDRAASEIRSIPGIDAVAFSDAGVGAGRVALEIEGAPVVDAGSRAQARALAISPGYFETLGTALRAGRDFDARDGTPKVPVVTVNRRFAHLHWRQDDVLGQRLRLYAGDAPGPWLTVVGVAPDLHHGDRAQADVEPALYLPLRQRPARGVWLLARTSLPPDSLSAAFRREVQAVDPEVPLWLGPYTLSEWMAGSYWRRGVNGGLFAMFALMALALASFGLFAVVANSVAQRAQELGVRIAFGATTRDVIWLVVREGLSPAISGLMIGLLASLATNQLLRAQLVDVPAWDPVTLSSVAVVLVLTALLGCLIPAFKATRTDPLTVIRAD